MFRFTVTNRADDKDNWLVSENTANGFIHAMVQRGHRPGAKDGSGIIAGIFKQGTRLEQKNLEVATGLILDIDGKFRRSGDTIPPGAVLSEDGKHYHEIVSPDWLLPRLPYRGVAHSSYNHGPAHPKYRVILPLEKPVTPQEFMRLWFWIYNLVDRKADPACKNPDRMFFMPRCTQEALDSGWPWVRPLYGPVLDYSMVPEDFRIPEEFAYALDRPQKRQGAHTAPPSTHFRKTDAYKLLDALQDLPLFVWAVENAEEVSREVWRGLATNIAAAVLDDETAVDAGSKLFHEISEADDNRYSQVGTEKTFRDALRSAQHPGPMTYKTLKMNGAPDEIDEGNVKSPVAHARHILSAQEAAQRPKGLAPGSPKPPGAAPATSTSGETAPGETTPGEAAPAGTDDPPPNVPIKELQLDSYTQKNFMYDIHRGAWIMQKMEPGTTELVWAIDTPIKEEAFNNKLVGLGLQRKQLDDWKMWIPRFDFRKAIYMNPDDQLVQSGISTYFNTYKPSALFPVPGNWDDIRALFLHLVNGDQKALEYTLDWYAAPLQKIRARKDPKLDSYKMGTALVYRGDPGAGKGTAMEILMLCYGLSNCVTLGQEDLDGKFHSNLIDKLFVVGNEIMSTSNRSAQTANKLKSWVTDPMIPCEGKYSDAGEIANNFNCVFTSNDERPIIIAKNDRRYSVFQSTAIPKNIIGPVRLDIIGAKQQVASFYEHLLSRQVKVQYGDLYETTARTQVQLASAPTAERFATAIAEDGFLSVAASWVDAARNGEIREPTITFHGEQYVLSDTFMVVYKHFCSGLGGHPQHVRAVTQAIEAAIPVAEPSLLITVGGVKRRAWRGLPVDSPNASVLPMPSATAGSATAVEIAVVDDKVDNVSFGTEPSGV